jgi:hypothetical protein
VFSNAWTQFGQCSALLIVVEAGEISVGDLSREAEMTSGAMTHLVDLPGGTWPGQARSANG